MPAAIAGQGTINITPSFTLQYVSHPKLAVNLLSINQITKDWNCNVTIFLSYCVFQDQIMGRMIGHASEWEGFTSLMFPLLFTFGC